jgi:anti-sigma B factor antagonist
VSLSLTTHREAGAITIDVNGDLDMSNVGQLEKEIAAAIGECTGIIIDLTEVPFIDSAGISALLKGRRMADEQGRRYRVTGAGGMVRQVLDMTGVWTHLSNPAS